MNTESESIAQKIKEVQDKFYSDTGKNMLFKKKQKMDCASEVTNQINIDELLHYSIYIIPNTNRIFADYTILKTFMRPEVYENIILKFMDLVDICVSTHGSYEYYLNLDTFTVSAFERYQGIFYLFYEVSDRKRKCYSDHMAKCEMLNSPNVVDILMKMFKPFMDSKMKNTIHVYMKKETPEVISQIFS